jgi:hypothetical protein
MYIYIYQFHFNSTDFRRLKLSPNPLLYGASGWLGAARPFATPSVTSYLVVWWASPGYWDLTNMMQLDLTNYQRIFKHIGFNQYFNQENCDMFFRYFAWFSQKRMGFEFGGSPVPCHLQKPRCHLIQRILEATHMWKRRPPSSLDEWLRYKHDPILVLVLVYISIIIYN